MIENICILFDGDNAPEIEISGFNNILRQFGEFLKSVESCKNIFYLNSKPTQFYSKSINKLEIIVTDIPRMSIDINESQLILRSDKKTYAKLGKSLINVFVDDEIEQNFQLDYFEGNELLNETDAILIFATSKS